MSSDRFFAIVTPGLEEQGVQDLSRTLGLVSDKQKADAKFMITTGGIEFSSDLAIVRAKQRDLGVVTRVLLRLDQFEARRFDVFTKKLSRIPFEKVLSPSLKVTVRVATHQSRLRIKKSLQNLSEKVIGKRLKDESRLTSAESPRKSENGGDSVKAKGDVEQLVFVRIVDDVVTVSVDVSGREGLYKRGVRTKVGAAPLRETYANAAVRLALEAADGLGLKRFNWIEPMAGSAVFTLELLRIDPMRAQSLTIYEANSKMLQTARETVSPEAAKLNRVAHFATRWPEPRDASEAVPTEPKVLIVNPPWGIRLKADSGLDASTLQSQKRLLQEFVRVFQPLVIVAVLPKVRGRFLDANSFPNGFQLWSSLELKVGGVPVRMIALSAKNSSMHSNSIKAAEHSE